MFNMNLLQTLKPAFQNTQCSVLLGWGKQENGTECVVCKHKHKGWNFMCSHYKLHSLPTSR